MVGGTTVYQVLSPETWVFFDSHIQSLSQGYWPGSRSSMLHPKDLEFTLLSPPYRRILVQSVSCLSSRFLFQLSSFSHYHPTMPSFRSFLESAKMPLLRSLHLKFPLSKLLFFRASKRATHPDTFYHNTLFIPFLGFIPNCGHIPRVSLSH